jgi:hypothetical protein
MEPRSSTALGCPTCSGVSVTVVRIHICPMKPSGLVPVHSAQALSAGGAVLHDASSYSGIHGRPEFGKATVHQDSQFAPHRRIAAASSLRYRSRMSRSLVSSPSVRSVSSLMKFRRRAPPYAAVTMPTGTLTVFFNSRAK